VKWPRPTLDPDIASTAALVGDPSRAAILSALIDGRALPAGELARRANITAQTASSHLDRLFKGGLLAVELRGRNHYYRLRDSRVAAMLEAIALASRPAIPRTALQHESAAQLRFARTCYGHLAGRLGVATTLALCRKGVLAENEGGFTVTERGEAWWCEFGVRLDELRRARRPLIRHCIDWSERQPHLSGALGDALARRSFELGWFTRIRDSRALRITERGAIALERELGVVVSRLQPSPSSGFLSTRYVYPSKSRPNAATVQVAQRRF
jgi:DNA-binding transcriptional ArsR family regulator